MKASADRGGGGFSMSNGGTNGAGGSKPLEVEGGAASVNDGSHALWDME
jgi:hypothetical protein